jgi:membrane protein YdbS with pleckstrin-like domain
LSAEEQKKSPKIAELATVVSVMVSILIAGTTLLNYSGNLPSWWFGFSLILLIALTFFMPVMIFARPVREKIRRTKLERKQRAMFQNCALKQ